MLSQESLNGDVSLQFVGPEGEYDSLAKKVLGSANVHGRAWVIYQWLKVLQKINCHYQLDDELPEFDEVKSRMKSANETLVKEAEHINDESIARETEIAKDDARHVRTVGSIPMEVDEDEDEEVDDFPMRGKLVTSLAKNAQGTDADHEYLVSASMALGIKEDDITSRREGTPLNDYENGDETIAKSAPDVFMFGTAYGSKGPTLSKFGLRLNIC